jgi:hypothetical protein
MAPMLASCQFLVPAVSVEFAAAESTKNPLLHAGRRPKGFRLALDGIQKLIDLTDNEVN